MGVGEAPRVIRLMQINNRARCAGPKRRKTMKTGLGRGAKEILRQAMAVELYYSPRRAILWSKTRPT